MGDSYKFGGVLCGVIKRAVSHIISGDPWCHQGVPEVSAHTARLLNLQATERAPHKFVWRSPFFDLAVASMAPTRPRNNKRSIESPPTTPQQSKRIRKEATTGTRSRYFQACSMRTDFWHPLMPPNARADSRVRAIKNHLLLGSFKFRL